MSKPKATNYKPDDDDLDSLTEEEFFEEGDQLSRQVIMSKYMEDISEILSQAYSDIEGKVNELLEDLEGK